MQLRLVSTAAVLAVAFLAAPLAAQPEADSPRPQARGTQARTLRGIDRIKAGDQAPDFKLPTPDGKQEVALSDFRGQRPVALIFGSYT
jgi:hypothetical protein